MASPGAVNNSDDNGGNILNDEKKTALSHFKDISGISDDTAAKHFLEANAWDLERAVHQFMGFGDLREQATRRRIVPPPPVELRPEIQHVYHAVRPQTSWFMQPLTWILFPVRFTYGVFCNLMNFVLSFIWPDPRLSVTDPAADVRNFVNDFKSKYVPEMQELEDATDTEVVHQPRIPPFFSGTYADALRDAKQSLRFLIIYLHGDSHEDTDKFCHETLLDQSVVNFLGNSEQMIFWACNINSPEGYRVSQVLRVHSFPFIGVVALSANPAYSSTSFGSATRMALLGRIEGLLGPSEFTAHLTQIMDDHQGVLVNERADRGERELSNRLRREQDEAFAESLAKDRAKAAERIANEQAAARLACEAAMTEQRAAVLARARLRRQRYWSRRLAAAAEAQPPPSTNGDAVRFSIKLPNGQRTQRVFSLKDSVKHLYYYIISQEGAPARFAIESNYPKRIIDCHPGNESDIEDYISAGTDDADLDDILRKRMTEVDANFWIPRESTDPPSFEDVGLTNPELLFILDLDS